MFFIRRRAAARTPSACRAVPAAASFAEADQEHVPPTVQPLLQRDAEYSARLASIRRLPAQLSPAEVDGLFAYLRIRGASEGLPGMQERMLKCFVMDLLVKQAGPLDRIANGLASVSRDPKQDAMVREYAVLYLGFCFDQAADPTRTTIRAVLAEAAAVPLERIRNTARHALEQIQEV